ncbi:hypothetical protein BFN01_04275 [Microbacterium sp. AR7-10]|nr:hypothetical protein BFN01_04275 [Microbacterium sp. AR7-10]
MDRLETMVYGRSSSVTNGRTRFAGNESILVEGSGKVEGWWIVTGTQRVTGRLEGSGVFDWTGPMNLRGAQTVTGDVTYTGKLTVNGPWKLVGAGEITGNVKLTGDFELLPGGRIKVDGMIIDPSGGGSVTFPGGAEVSADPGGGIRMIQGANRVYVGSGLVSLQYGTRSYSISASGHRMGGLNVRESALANGAPAGTVWADESGGVYRIIP